MGRKPRHFIRWSSATVEPIGDFYELHVELDTDASRRWIDSFNDEATSDYRGARTRPWGTVAMWGTTIVVEEGAEAVLMTYLGDLVAATDRSGDSDQNGDEGRARADNPEERARVAKAMASLFRLG